VTTVAAVPTGDHAPLAGLNIGDIFEDRLIPATEGVKTRRRVNGRICFIQHQYDQTLAGDRWRLKLVGENPRGTVYFAETVELLDAGDGLTELFRSLNIADYAMKEVRKAQRTVVESERACAPESIGLAGAILEVARDRMLPEQYRRWLAVRAKSIYEKQIPENDPRLLTVLKVLAHTASDAEKVGAFEAVVIMQDAIGDSQQARVGALANLGHWLLNQERHSEAVTFFRRARELTGDDFVASQLAVCLAKQGDFEEAYNLIAEFPDTYFSCVEGEWNESRYDILREEADEQEADEQEDD